MMNMDIIVVADLFIEDLLGGAELHDDVIVKYFIGNNRLFSKKRCVELTEDFIMQNRDKKWFIANFSSLSINKKALLSKYCRYIIYEHDYKFVDSRNPISYPDFLVPHQNIVNVNFYSQAKKVVCLSKMHREIFEKNLKLNNYENFNCSMWNDEQLKLLEKYGNNLKNTKYAIIKSDNPLKKTRETVKYCQNNNIEYDLISSKNYEEFIKILSRYKGLVFLTGHPEPTPRIAIESKMLNLKFICQKNLNCVVNEDYYHLQGKDMIEKVREMRDTNLRIILEWLDEI